MSCGTCKTCLRRKAIMGRVDQLRVVVDIATRLGNIEVLEMSKHELRCLRLEWDALSEQVKEEIEDMYLGQMLQEAIDSGLAAEA